MICFLKYVCALMRFSFSLLKQFSNNHNTFYNTRWTRCRRKVWFNVYIVHISTIQIFIILKMNFLFLCSTRVSNALGAGNPQAARVAVRAAVFLTVLETVIMSSILYASRHAFGYLFSNEKEVVDYVTTMAPLICLCVMLNGFQAVLSGIARGCGWQDLGAYVNLIAYYLCGIPVAAILGFWLQLRGQGLWIGIQVGAFVQSILLAILTSCQNWEKQVSRSNVQFFSNPLTLF
ncbi:hypothetical protein Patl1_15210 [Pistacia atlantica]|uniref:Uncharacterized protein n=1 Tax=Pistacia atlantica TaxID=434234 RepID=A0ACC1BA75_9ROSI|nr:hypothetical protein Patl1_15210 [Pistacia atlantica]